MTLPHDQLLSKRLDYIFWVIRKKPQMETHEQQHTDNAVDNPAVKVVTTEITTSKTTHTTEKTSALERAWAKLHHAKASRMLCEVVVIIYYYCCCQCCC